MTAHNQILSSPSFHSNLGGGNAYQGASGQTLSLPFNVERVDNSSSGMVRGARLSHESDSPLVVG